MAGPFSPKSADEMNVRQARTLRNLILAQHPSWRVEVWPIAQGIARLVIEPTPDNAFSRLVLRSPKERYLVIDEDPADEELLR